MTDNYYSFLCVFAIVMAALGGFAVGFILADNRRKADDAYSPKLRPDRYHEDHSKSA